MRITWEHVDRRFGEFAKKYEAILANLEFDADVIVKNVAYLRQRLAQRDFKLYGDRPVNLLHAGKRGTRFLIKLALETCPREKARRRRLLDQYSQRVAEIRKDQPAATFFSFEAAYADKLRVDLRPHRQMFFL